MKFFKGSQFQFERDMLRIGYTIFSLDKRLRNGYVINKLKIPVSLRTFLKVDTKELSKEIEELISYVLVRNIDVELVSSSHSKRKYRKEVKTDFKKYENICLFSGGVDSTSGIIESKKSLKNICGVFVAHSDQKGTIRTVNNLANNFLKPNDIGLYRIFAPPIGIGGYAQLRGFLYIFLSSIYAKIFNAKNIVVTECGPTMYQPQFGSFDSTTMTTNPFVMEKTKNIIQILLKREINVITPFENMTKAEVLMHMPKQVMKDTYSCVSQMFRIHDGSCYGCIIRRLASIITGHEDAPYRFDVLKDNGSHSESLLSLLRFSNDVIFDFENMPSFSKQNIEGHDKKELFTRFALDNFLALQKYSEKGLKLNPMVNNFFKDSIKDFDKDVLEKRNDDIEKMKNKPDFRKVV
jgi:7-cyano-7-deazaguanine synthase in queuosine biosynthesis